MPKIESQNTTCIEKTLIRVIDLLTVAEHLEIQFAQVRQIQSEKIVYEVQQSFNTEQCRFSVIIL